ncbi:unnamed protein product [Acanthoscelides obtectus]|uniref:Uncharacterized protein n=1 Tax=Acanthoscelides obtectus TaxID=200917 RepID=A0A9P0PG14_ACAOB|nr:unnamed protein product [Acanthoscelides obtectus]CAK1674603.1 hypothetical protein AOBTE_LOCUS29675 [Acanthoscelides obtectus]
MYSLFDRTVEDVKRNETLKRVILTQNNYILDALAHEREYFKIRFILPEIFIATLLILLAASSASITSLPSERSSSIWGNCASQHIRLLCGMCVDKACIETGITIYSAGNLHCGAVDTAGGLFRLYYLSALGKVFLYMRFILPEIFIATLLILLAASSTSITSLPSERSSSIWGNCASQHIRLLCGMCVDKACIETGITNYIMRASKYLNSITLGSKGAGGSSTVARIHDSDIDPIYVPEETTDSDSSIVPFIPHETKNRIQVPKKRKITPKERKGRKRVKNTNEWIDVRAKKELNLGIEHKNRKGTIIPAKQIKNPCKENCRNKCRQKISEEERKALFEEFWKIGDHSRQWDYIVRYVKTVEKKHVKRTDSKSRRNHSRTYQLLVNNKEITVCKTMFLNKYGISEQWVTTALGKIGETGTLEEDRRGKHLTRPNKIDGGVLNRIREHIQLFPVVPSHYTRKKSTKMYLEDGINISIMHRLYL